MHCYLRLLLTTFSYVHFPQMVDTLHGQRLDPSLAAYQIQVGGGVGWGERGPTVHAVDPALLRLNAPAAPPRPPRSRPCCAITGSRAGIAHRLPVGSAECPLPPALLHGNRMMGGRCAPSANALPQWPGTGSSAAAATRRPSRRSRTRVTGYPMRRRRTERQEAARRRVRTRMVSRPPPPPPPQLLLLSPLLLPRQSQLPLSLPLALSSLWTWWSSSRS